MPHHPDRPKCCHRDATLARRPFGGWATYDRDAVTEWVQCWVCMGCFSYLGDVSESSPPASLFG